MDEKKEKIQKQEEPKLQKFKWGKKSILTITIAIIITLLIFSSLVYLFLSFREMGLSNYKVDENIINTSGGYYLEDGKLYRTEDNKLLFTNLPPSIKKVVDGPNDNSIHFLDENSEYSRCYILSAQSNRNKTYDISIQGDKEKIIAKFSPWDYDVANNERSPLLECRSGHVLNSDSLAYIKISRYNLNVRSDLMLEIYDTSTNLSKSIKIGEVFTKDNISDYYNSPNSVPDAVNESIHHHYLEGGVMVNDNFFFDVNGKIIGIDVKEERVDWIFDGYDDSKVFNDVLWLENKNNLPLVLVKSGWEADEYNLGIIDLSGNEYNYISLDTLDAIDLTTAKGKGYETEVWQNDGIVFTDYLYTDLKEEISSLLSEEDKLNAITDQALAEELNEKYEKLLSSSGSYDSVKCYIGDPIASYVCAGISKNSSYKYTIGGKLNKIED